MTDEVSNGLWGQQRETDYHSVNGKAVALESQIKVYGVHISSSTSVLDVLSSLNRPLDNDSRPYQGLILVSVKTTKAYACAQAAGSDF